MSEFYEETAQETATTEATAPDTNLTDILKSLQTTLTDLKAAYNSMTEQLVDLETMSQQEEKINICMNWVYEHCDVDAQGKFTVGNTQYTWIRFLKDVFNNKIDLSEIQKHMYPKNGSNK